MSRKKDERNRRKAERQNFEAEFDARPKPAFPQSPKPRSQRRGTRTKFLTPGGDWTLRELGVEISKVYKSRRDVDFVATCADELREEGFLPPEGVTVKSDSEFVEEYLTALEKVALTPDLYSALWDEGRELGERDADALIRYLEIDPFCSSSGYLKERAIKRLRRCATNVQHRRRIAEVLRYLVRQGWTVNMVGWLSLVPLADEESVWALVAEGIEMADLASRQRAILIAIRAKGYSNAAQLGQVWRDCDEWYRFGPAEVRRWLEERTEDTKV